MSIARIDTKDTCAQSLDETMQVTISCERGRQVTQCRYQKSAWRRRGRKTKTAEEEEERLRGYQKVLQAKAENAPPDSQVVALQESHASQPFQPLENSSVRVPQEKILFYGAKPFQPGERIVWKWQKTVGVFKRHIAREFYLTNQRFLFISHEQRAYNQAPIQMVEAFVISSHTERAGSGTRFSGGFGMSFGTWNGTSRTYGVVNFMSEGQLIGSVYVPDPHGLVREVKAIKKTTKASAPKSTARVETGTKPDVAGELGKLAGLVKEGLLTQDEYIKAKNKLLN